MNKTRYAKDVKGSIRVWMITAHDTGLTIEHGMMGGSLQTKEEPINIGKGARTRDQQIYSRYLSRINQQYDKGYDDNLLKVQQSKRTNSMGLLRPMLAAPIKNVRNIDYGHAFYQHKYDGNRCLITKQDGRNRCLITKQDGIIIAYSRNGKPVTSIGHILDGIQLVEGETIDGELYCHGVPLQRICSWIKREQDATKNLSMRVYDIVDNSPYIERLARLESLSLGDNAGVVPTVRVESEESLDGLLEASLSDGYEGGILRWGDAGYEDGKRSKSLAKIKVFEDDEYEVVGIVASKDGWAILVCEMPDGKLFRVSAPGTMDKKFEIMLYIEDYIGKMVQIKYANMTKDGIPFHPVAIRFRDKSAE